jgi:hypothetical protein
VLVVHGLPRILADVGTGFIARNDVDLTVRPDLRTLPIVAIPNPVVPDGRNSLAARISLHEREEEGCLFRHHPQETSLRIHLGALEVGFFPGQETIFRSLEPRKPVTGIPEALLPWLASNLAGTVAMRRARIALLRCKEGAVTLVKDVISAERTHGRMLASHGIQPAQVIASHLSNSKTSQVLATAYIGRSIAFFAFILLHDTISTGRRKGTASLDVKDTVRGACKGTLNSWTQERLAGMSAQIQPVTGLSISIAYPIPAIRIVTAPGENQGTLGGTGEFPSGQRIQGATGRSVEISAIAFFPRIHTVVATKPGGAVAGS